MVPRIFLYGDRAWQFGDWEVRLLCRTCKGEKFADDPQDTHANARPATGTASR